MSKDILEMYGNDVRHPQTAPAKSGGVTEAKPLAYSPPVGPKGINDPQTPGLHGSNKGNCGTQS